MNTIRPFFACLLLAFALFSCDPVATTDSVCSVKVSIALPVSADTMHTVSVQQLSFVFTDLNMGRNHTYAPQNFTMEDSVHIVSSLHVSSGYYDVEATILLSLDSTDIQLRAYSKNLVLDSQKDTVSLSMTASVVQERNTDFVLAEVFVAGTQTNEGKTYTGDSYFVLYNNTETTLYADGIVLLESKLKSVQKLGTLTPYFIDDYFGADAIYRIPGSGTDYPVAPGGTLLIADNAQDHRKANPNSFDLSSADFEWYDQSTSASVTDIDNPDVPNLDKIYCYTRTIWIPNRQGNTSFALGRIPAGITDSAYLVDYYCKYDYTLITNTGTFPMNQSCYLFPNQWVIDCVNLSPHSSYQWLVVASGLDAGWTYIGETGSDKSRFGKSVRRRERMQDGQRILQDTNNSTLDFLPVQQADPFYYNR